MTTSSTEGYLDGRGAVELRSALADYLNRVRGTSADPDTIVITTGYAQAVSLLVAVLAARGATTVAVEDPSASDDARPIADALGLNVIGVPVGDDGVRVDTVDELDADVLILTRSHQWPTGGVLSPQARAAVLAWAQRTGALVLEDDYDAEYRYDRAPIGAMQGLDPNRVAYAGTASKTLARGFRLGWVETGRGPQPPTLTPLADVGRSGVPPRRVSATACKPQAAPRGNGHPAAVGEPGSSSASRTSNGPWKSRTNRHGTTSAG